MQYNPDIHHRHCFRLKDYNYSLCGIYFITIRTNRKQRLFGEIQNRTMNLNTVGIMVNRWLDESTRKFPAIDIDSRIIMPDHIHFIILIKNRIIEDICIDKDESIIECAPMIEGIPLTPGAHTGAPLHEVIQWFKTMTTNEYIKGVKTRIFKPFDRQIWQRSFYDRIIRNEQELHHIRKYIIDNPMNVDSPT